MATETVNLLSEPQNPKIDEQNLNSEPKSYENDQNLPKSLPEEEDSKQTNSASDKDVTDAHKISFGNVSYSTTSIDGDSSYEPASFNEDSFKSPENDDVEPQSGKPNGKHIEKARKIINKWSDRQRQPRRHMTKLDDGHREPLPSFIKVKRPSANVKMFCTLWALLMSLLGFTAKLYGYMKLDASKKNKSYSLYTSFIQLFGIGSLFTLFFLQWRQKKLSNNHFVYDPHNGSFYLKAGLLGFTIGTLMYNSLQLAQDISLLMQHPDCGSVEYSTFHFISFIYNVLQCILLLLFSKVTFTYCPNLALLCLAHLVAVCLHSWFSFVADEFTESLIFEHDAAKEHEELCSKFEENSTFHESIEKTEVFLFPMSIELYLIAGGFFTIMSSNVGKPHVVKDCHNSVVYGRSHKDEWNSKFFIQETFAGFMIGVALVLLTAVLVVFKHTLHEEYSFLPAIFHWFIFSINAMMLVCIVVIHQYLKKRELHKRFHNRIDAPLLFVALSGIAVYSLFSVFSGLHGMSHNEEKSHDAIGTFVGYGSHLVQSVAQTVFLLDALRRTAAPTDKSRNFLIILLAGNIALWVTQMFELNFEDDVNPMQVSLYGEQHWALITHILGPLAIFFRFHSAACLFDVWHTCYKIDGDKPNPKWRRHLPAKFSASSFNETSAKNSTSSNVQVTCHPMQEVHQLSANQIAENSQPNNSFIMTNEQGKFIGILQAHPSLSIEKIVPPSKLSAHSPQSRTGVFNGDNNNFDWVARHNYYTICNIERVHRSANGKKSILKGNRMYTETPI
ncbi:proton channel OtopLc-like isoform X4 [Convolutriloba macropyga]|uniref:proton channel OtopLc-like isoform X4 n=1 Tax=Convolutriloba macropyga TaxID=536237 RepID=UPI003F51E95B